jgi:hypothetical protein
MLLRMSGMAIRFEKGLETGEALAEVIACEIGETIQGGAESALPSVNDGGVPP